mmetsp:Transcript_8787/g.17778  ORF Transcript_8787/g.17778 Transcript_8787/m.17778 type:complete len:329 (-) Transcript_8787:690-1676(-)
MVSIRAINDEVALEDRPTFLVVIIDVNPAVWTIRNGAELGATMLSELLEQTFLFLASFLLLHRENRVAIVLASSETCSFAFPDESQREMIFQRAEASTRYPPNAAEQPSMAAIKDAVHTSLINLHGRDSDTYRVGSTAMASALSRSLCMINRLALQDQSEQTTKYLANPRILVQSVGRDAQSQYVATMNCIFSAQRMGVPIDCLKLGAHDSVFFQQAAHLTHGLYLQPGEVAMKTFNHLFSMLIFFFIPDSDSRERLTAPTMSKVDFRAICFQTKRAIDMGFTCSVCLSTYSNNLAPVCRTCGARQPLDTRKLSIGRTGPIHQSSITK